MKKYRFIILAVLICLAASALGYFWTTASIDSLYTFRSPLNNAPPVPGDAFNDSATERLVFILVDGLRLDTSLKSDVMPTLDGLRDKGAYAVMHSRPTSYSMPSYTVLLTGAWTELNGASLMNLDFTDIQPFSQDDLISAVHRKGLKTAISGFIWFQKMVPQSSVDDGYYTPGEDHQADELVMEHALSWLDDRIHSFILIHLDQVDYAGHHEGGPEDPRWDAAANRVDGMIAQIVEKLDWERDTLVVLSDHGHIPIGGHGGQDPDVLLEPFILVGKGVKPGDYGDMQMVDVAPTLAALMGTNIPAAAQGRVLKDMLILPESTLAALPGAVSDQQLALLDSYFHVMGEVPSYLEGEKIDATIGNLRMGEVRNRQLWAERLPRYVLVALFFVLTSYLMIRSKPGEWILILAGVVIYLLIFNFRYAILDRMTYSLSSIIGQTELILYCAITAAISFTASWVFVMVFSRSLKQTPIAAAKASLNFTLVLLVVLFIPVMLHYAANGWVVARFMPLFLLQFIAVFTLIQVIFLGALGLFFAAISAGIGWVLTRKHA